MEIQISDFVLSLSCYMLVGEAKIPIFTVFGLTYHIVLKNDTLFVPSGQIDIPYVYKPLAMMNVVGRIWEFLIYDHEVVDLKEFDLCLLYLIANRE